jgi:hypothetical protein
MSCSQPCKLSAEKSVWQHCKASLLEWGSGLARGGWATHDQVPLKQCPELNEGCLVVFVVAWVGGWRRGASRRPSPQARGGVCGIQCTVVVSTVARHLSCEPLSACVCCGMTVCSVTEPYTICMMMSVLLPAAQAGQCEARVLSQLHQMHVLTQLMLCTCVC